MNPSLLQALRTVIRSDSDPARQVLFENLRGASLPARLAYGLHEWLGVGWASAVLVAGYGLAAYCTVAPPGRRAPVLAVGKYNNARRQVERVAGWIGPEQCAWVRTGVRGALRRSLLPDLARLLRRRTPRRILRIVRRIDARHGFLVSCRVAGAIAWYARARTILAARRPGAVLVSGDSHPEEVGLTAAARLLGTPQIFVSHAYPTPFTPPLRYSLSILEGAAAAEARQRVAPATGELLLAGIEGPSAPMDPRRLLRPQPVVGLFTPKAVSWPTLSAVIEECRRDIGTAQILIRWHPSMFERPHLARILGDVSGIVETSPAESLVDVARRCDWVVADENSNVHLQVLKLGIPTVAVQRMGVYPESRTDLYGFAANGVVFPPVTALGGLPLDQVAGFFDDAWAERFRRYDAAYLKPPEEVAREVRCAVGRLLERAGWDHP